MQCRYSNQKDETRIAHPKIIRKTPKAAAKEKKKKDYKQKKRLGHILGHEGAQPVQTKYLMTSLGPCHTSAPHSIFTCCLVLTTGRFGWYPVFDIGLVSGLRKPSERLLSIKKMHGSFLCEPSTFDCEYIFGFWAHIWTVQISNSHPSRTSHGKHNKLYAFFLVIIYALRCSCVGQL